MIPVLRRASKSRAAVGRSSGSGSDPLHRPSPLESGRPASVQADRRPVAVGVRGLGLLRQRAGLDLLHDLDGRVDRHREPDALVAAGLRVDLLVDADDPPLGVDERPPELPGLMAAAVWMPPLIAAPFGGCSSRYVADTTPEDSEKSRPSGLPMATTSSPPVTLDESPRGMGSSPGVWLGSTLTRATSVDSSAPSTVPSTCVPGEPSPLKITVTVLTAWPFSPTTWALVRM